MTCPRSINRAVLVVSLAAAACSQSQHEAARTVVAAPVELARATTFADTRVTTGTVRSTTAATLSAKVLGNVTRVFVSEGDAVRAGQLLVEIDNRDVRAKVDQARAGARAADEAIAAANAGIAGAEANANFADATFARFAALRERGSVSPHEFEEVAAKQKGAQAELDRAKRGREALLAQHAQALAGAAEAETYLSYTQVRSPIDGIVSARFVDAGAQAAPGVPLIAVEDPRQHRVETTVDEDLATRVRPGDVVDVNGTAARVAQVAPVDPQTRTAFVKIALPPASTFRSGTFVRVSFPTGTRNAITVPPAAIVRRGELASLFVVDNSGVAHMRLITTGEPRDGRVEILSGLDAGERIVTAGSGLSDGVQVRGTL